jgi:hypothetical protein
MQEVTEWQCSTPNHIYIFDDCLSHAIAYVPEGSRTVQKFSKPMSIDRRGRRFVDLEDHAVEPPKASVWQVPGSRGADHTVTMSQGYYSCTCPGFTYRGRCRHVTDIQQAHAVEPR